MYTKNSFASFQSPEFFAELIKSYTKNSVLDLYLGSGTTMVAAHQLKRKCYGMELDNKYCQVIIDRMLKLDETLEVRIFDDLQETGSMLSKQERENFEKNLDILGVTNDGPLRGESWLKSIPFAPNI